MTTDLKQAYRQCQKIANSHYENFPVASLILPKKIRTAVAVIYVFARRADDIADEGEQDASSRLNQLQEMELALQQISDGQVSDDYLYIALADVIRQFNTPISLYLDLLSAFTQDVTTTRYQHFGEVMDYCRRSANPVGRLLLHLFNQADDKNLALSDGICSALQLINFYQDLAQDYDEMQRIYIPLEDMDKFGVTETHFAQKITDRSMQQLMQAEYERAEKLMRAGGWLGKRLTGRAGFEIRLIIAAGSRVLQKLKAQKEDVFSRPRLTLRDYGWVFWKAVRRK